MEEEEDDDDDLLIKSISSFELRLSHFSKFLQELWQ